MDDLDIVLKNLKPDKSRVLGYLNEIFKPDIIGSDLKLAIHKLMNQIKKKQLYQDYQELCSITSILKKKGSKHAYNN